IMLNEFGRRNRFSQRRFRPAVRPLEERWLPSVQMGGEFGSMQFSPDGSLNYLFWNGDDLTYEHRGSNGVFAGEVVAHEPDSNTQPPAHRGNQAQLVYSADGTPNVFYLHNGVNVAHYLRGAGGWSLVEDLSPPTTGANFESYTHLVAATGPGGRFHL